MTADVLVVGANGRVGAALARSLPTHGLTVAAVSHAEGDPVERVRDVSPRVVVYAAAIAEPDRCEREPAESYDVNVAGAGRVASATAAVGGRMIYYSSDYVFGSPGSYLEDAPTSPLQRYGSQKVEAEQLVLDGGDNVVIRLPLLFGDRDFIAQAVHATLTGTALARDDRRRFPIPLQHVVDVTARACAGGLPPGIYHAVGVDSVTKSEWACYIAGLLDRSVPPVAAAPDAGPGIAARPVDVELATRHPEMCTPQGTLWEVTRTRVAELIDSDG